MARIGRFVVPELPHHVTQRGNRRDQVFFSDADYELYRDLRREAWTCEGVAAWSYCLMPDHEHLILRPETGGARPGARQGPSALFRLRQRAQRVTGRLFQARFSSVVMDEGRLMAGARYMAMNPVRARLVERAEDWPWSSARAHLAAAMTGWSRSRRSFRAAPGASRAAPGASST
jgi:putative transposase